MAISITTACDNEQDKIQDWTIKEILGFIHVRDTMLMVGLINPR